MKRLTGWLAVFRASLKRELAAIEALGRAMVEIDIKRRARDRAIGIRYARHRNRLIKELDKIGVSEVAFCRTLGRGHSLSTMHRRMRLASTENWDRYVRKRRERGDDGAFRAAYLAVDRSDRDETEKRPTPSHCASDDDDPDHLVLHGDARDLLRTRPTGSVQVAITSPPYWPARRLYIPDDPNQIGMEPTLEEYLDHLMAIFTEVKRVLRDDGVCWVLLDDAISEAPYRYAAQSYHSSRSPLKEATQINITTQDTRYLAPAGDWLDIPGRFARAMQSIGWRWRDTIIWSKGSAGRKESTSSRCRRNYELLFMFTKNASDYWYDQDPLRIASAGGQPHSVRRGSARSPGWEGQMKPRKDGLLKGYTIPGKHKDGTLRRDGDRDFRVWSNPLGRIHDAVWYCPPKGWRGVHSSAMPEKLVENCLLLTGRPGGTVMDPFGGSGTVSAVAKRMGFRSIYIDRHFPSVEEARSRLATTHRDDDEFVVANDNAPRTTLAGD
jgi:DNA modification methylase